MIFTPNVRATRDLESWQITVWGNEWTSDTYVITFEDDVYCVCAFTQDGDGAHGGLYAPAGLASNYTYYVSENYPGYARVSAVLGADGHTLTLTREVWAMSWPSSKGIVLNCLGRKKT